MIHNKPDSKDPSDHPETGRVSLVFENPDGSTLRLTRAIVGTGERDEDEDEVCETKYTIDEAEVSEEDFRARLLEVGVNTKAHNSLVFQVRRQKRAQAPASPLACIRLPQIASCTAAAVSTSGLDTNSVSYARSCV